jgi:hypothetical protein
MRSRDGTFTHKLSNRHGKASVLILLYLSAATHHSSLEAQESRVNTSLGVGLSAPISSTGHYAGESVNTVVGVGYNFDAHNSLIGEFMYANLPPTSGSLAQIAPSTPARSTDGTGSLFTVTGNYRLTLERKVLGTYFIGGGGMYYRYQEPSQKVVVASGTPCTGAWQWYGYSCSGGIVSTTVAPNYSSAAFGGNVGIGFTVRLGDVQNFEGYKFFVESRYHYAPNRNIPTQIITITVGVRWW